MTTSAKSDAGNHRGPMERPGVMGARVREDDIEIVEPAARLTIRA
jgi:hypothetical protein